jgi:2-polyprenyl-3-methyl-5-hydroxy-6-metoxy-1,4-benzoquinol methylase
LRTRIGNGFTEEQYQVVRDNFIWNDHILRTYCTAAAIAWLKPETVCDPACGDGSIVEAAHQLSWIETAYLSDISKPNIERVKLLDVAGDLVADVGNALDMMVDADVIVLTEILEHVEDPDSLVREARVHGKYLVASSPLNETSSGNHEHIWGFSKQDYSDMLTGAGWTPIAYQELSPDPFYYTFQLWVCK